ncbi:MAG: glycosyltransferase 87 family protein [Mycobacteriales bacterium]
MQDRRYLASAGASAVAAAALSACILLVNGVPLGPDLWLQQLAGRPAVWPGLVAELGSGAVLYPVLLAIALWRRTLRAALLPVLLALAQVVEVVVLSALPRSGPDLAWAGLSSGRTASAVVGAGLIAWAADPRARALLVGPLLGAAVGWSRVAAGAHWASDALLGLLVGGALLSVAVAVAGAVPDRSLQLPVVRAGRWSSAWLWLLPAGASLVPLLSFTSERSGHLLIDLQVYVGSAGAVDGGQDLYAYRTPQGLPFTYPPFAALLAEPLARMPLPVVRVLWTAASLLGVIGVARTAMRPVVARLGLPITVTLLLLSTPVRSHLRFGQVGLFLVLLVSWDLLTTTRRQGAGVGLAAAIKLTPAIYLLWLLACRQWSRAKAALAWATAATAGGLLVLWPSSPSWLRDALWDADRFGPNGIPGNQSVRGMLLRTPLSDAAAATLWLVCALVLLAAGVAGARRLEHAGRRLAAVGVLAATSVAVSPISWQHHLVWLALPLAALVEGRQNRLAAAWAAVLIAPTTTLALHVSTPVLGPALVDTCGLTAVAAVLLLPRLLLPRPTSLDGGRERRGRSAA